MSRDLTFSFIHLDGNPVVTPHLPACVGDRPTVHIAFGGEIATHILVLVDAKAAQRLAMSILAALPVIDPEVGEHCAAARAAFDAACGEDMTGSPKAVTRD